MGSLSLQSFQQSIVGSLYEYKLSLYLLNCNYFLSLLYEITITSLILLFPWQRTWNTYHCFEARPFSLPVCKQLLYTKKAAIMSTASRRSSSISSTSSSDNSTTPKSGKSNSNGIKKKFACTHDGCGKSFSRSEHLHRHALNHKDGNNTCQRCSAHFRRRDLLGLCSLSSLFGLFPDIWPRHDWRKSS